MVGDLFPCFLPESVKQSSWKQMLSLLLFCNSLHLHDHMELPCGMPHSSETFQILKEDLESLLWGAIFNRIQYLGFQRNWNNAGSNKGGKATSSSQHSAASFYWNSAMSCKLASPMLTRCTVFVGMKKLNASLNCLSLSWASAPLTHRPPPPVQHTSVVVL